MKFIVTLLIILTCYTQPAHSQSDVEISYNWDKTYQNQSTSMLGRWELIMSDRAAKNTFKIDKFTGKVLALYQTTDDLLYWKLVPREASISDTQKPDSVNYQLYMGAVAMRHTYLVNINTGQTWILVINEDEELSFQAFD